MWKNVEIRGTALTDPSSQAAMDGEGARGRTGDDGETQSPAAEAGFADDTSISLT